MGNFRNKLNNQFLRWTTNSGKHEYMNLFYVTAVTVDSSLLKITFRFTDHTCDIGYSNKDELDEAISFLDSALGISLGEDEDEVKRTKEEGSKK
jgi:hypothetical protein